MTPANPYYVATGAWLGSGTILGRPMHEPEFDFNTWNFQQAIEALQALNIGVGIQSITQPNTNQLQITLTNNYVFTFTFPGPEFNFRNPPTGAWQAFTAYVKNDMFVAGGGLYAVALSHTSGATFNPLANDGLGHNYYRLALALPSLALPSGGNADDVLGKIDGTSYNWSWRPGILRGGTTGQVYSKNSSGDYDVGWNTLNMPWSGLTGSPSAAQLRDPVVTALVDVSGVVSLDPSIGDGFTFVPVEPCTINASSTPAGARITIVITTSGVSSYNLTFGANFKSAGVLATGTSSGKVWTITFFCDGVNLNEVSRAGPM
jgi:hypothetical protein